jgi:hypothetical protein
LATVDFVVVSVLDNFHDCQVDGHGSDGDAGGIEEDEGDQLEAGDGGRRKTVDEPILLEAETGRGTHLVGMLPTTVMLCRLERLAKLVAVMPIMTSKS